MQSKLVPMLIGEHHFKEIAMASLREVPESEHFNAILMITDQFTKV